jgi:hypothetical protein
MKKLVLILLLFVSVSVGRAQGASIVGQATENGLGLSDGTDHPQGNLVRIGVFNISDSLISANAMDLGFLNANFQEFGTGRIGQNVNLAGLFQTTPLDRPNSDLEGFGGKQICMWVFASTDNSTAATSFATAFQHGIFYREFTSLGDPNNPSGGQWRIRTNDEIPNDVTIDLGDLTNNTNDQLSPGAHVLVGGFGAGTNDATNFKNFNLAIPEPSAVGLTLAGAAAVLLRRRRN